jgi:hypothetical protein
LDRGDPHRGRTADRLRVDRARRRSNVDVNHDIDIDNDIDIDGRSYDRGGAAR